MEKEIINEAIEKLSYKNARYCGSRRETIVELLKALKGGNYGNTDTKGYDLWVRTWIFPKIFNLIPELKEIKNNRKWENQKDYQYL